MKLSRSLRILAAGAAALAAGCTEMEIELASERINAPYVRTSYATVDQMLTLAKAGPNDVIYDLGSGDGRIPIVAAERFHVRKGVGIDMNPDLVRLSADKARAAGVADHVSFLKGDVFKIDFGEATVITIYLLPELNLGLRPRLLKLRPGTRIVSHQFDMGDWKPDATAITDERSAPGADALPGRNRLYLWIVPAAVEGRWRMTAGGDTISLQLSQTFQRVAGTIDAYGSRSTIRDGRIDGDRLRFAATVRRDGRDTPLAFDGRAAKAAISGALTVDGRTDTVTMVQAE